jgi:hypothetical protein
MAMNLFDKLERKLISSIRKHMKVTNELAHTDDMLDLITTVSYDGYIVFSHKLSLNELYEIFKERLEQEKLYEEINRDLEDIG